MSADLMRGYAIGTLIGFLIVLGVWWFWIVPCDGIVIFEHPDPTFPTSWTYYGVEGHTEDGDPSFIAIHQLGDGSWGLTFWFDFLGMTGYSYVGGPTLESLEAWLDTWTGTQPNLPNEDQGILGHRIIRALQVGCEVG